MFNKKIKEQLQAQIEENDRLAQSLRKQATEIKDLKQKLDQVRASSPNIKDLEKKLDEAKLSLEEYQKKDHISDTNHIYFLISDDLQTVTPIVRYKDGVADKLVEQRILNDGDISPYAVQIGLALVVRDALDLIIENATDVANVDG